MLSLAGESERRGSGARAMAGYSIFIAHAPADAQVAEAVTQLLAETGATVLYGADTSPTPAALEDLEQTALAADAYVVLLSRASITSPRIRAVTRKYHEQRQTFHCGPCCPSCSSHSPRASSGRFCAPIRASRHCPARSTLPVNRLWLRRPSWRWASCKPYDWLFRRGCAA